MPYFKTLPSKLREMTRQKFNQLNIRVKTFPEHQLSLTVTQSLNQPQACDMETIPGSRHFIWVSYRFLKLAKFLLAIL